MDNNEKIALLVVDVQNALVDENPYKKEDFIGNLVRLIEVCRQNEVEVIYVQHNEEDSEFQYGSKGWEIYAAVKPIEGEKIFHKNYNSSFRGTGLREYLETKGITSLIITGMQTEYCIDTTVKVAFEYGYTLILPEETNTTFDRKGFSGKDLYEYYNFSIFKNRFGTVESLEKTLERLKR